MRISAGKSLLVVIIVLLLPIAALAVLLFRPISLPYFTGYLQGLASQQYYADQILFERARVKWAPEIGALEIYLTNVAAIDFDGDRIGRIPEVVVGVSAFPALLGDLRVRYINLRKAHISIQRTAGGAIKFDLGPTDEGVSGKLLENLLVDLATAKAAADSPRYFPSVSFERASFNISDELTGMRLRVPKTNIVLNPETEGVVGHVDMEMHSGGERLFARADLLFKTSNQTVKMRVTFDRLRPALLAEVLPQIGFLSPVEVPISGTIDVNLSKVLDILQMSFDLAGHSGSLEIGQYLGRNMTVSEVQVRGQIQTAPLRVVIDDAQVSLGRGEIAAKGAVAQQDGTLDIQAEMRVADLTLTDLMPRIFAQLESSVFAKVEQDFSASPEVTELAFAGNYDIASLQVSGLAELAFFGEQGAGQDSSAQIGTETRRNWQVDVGGTLGSLNMVVLPGP